MDRAAGLLFGAKAVRTFCYGYLGVLLPVTLSRRGLGAGEIGAALSLTLLASAACTLAVRAPARRVGPRPVLMGLSGLIVASGTLFLLSRGPWGVVVAAMVGNVAVGAGETGPFLTLEQVLLARQGSREALTRLYSLYNLTGYVAAALGAALVSRELVSLPTLFAVFAASGLVQAALYAALGDAVAAPVPPAGGLRMPSAPLVRRVAALFALDSFAGGFVVSTLVLYWFHIRFGLDLPALGLVAFGTQLVTGLSYLLAPPLARRIGLVNAMVFSHLVSNLFLAAIAWAPSAGAAVTLLLLRHALSQIDVPTRQAYLMSTVEDHERESAASVTNTSRALAQCVSPSLAGWVMGALSVSAPFWIGGGIKIAYDLMLYATVRRWEKAEA